MCGLPPPTPPLADAINYLIPSSPPPHPKFKQNIEADVLFEENNITIN